MVHDPQSPAEKEPAPILANLVDLKPYEQALRGGRIWLLVMAVACMGAGVYSWYTSEDRATALPLLLIDTGAAAPFVAFAYWSRKQPVPAFGTALLTYIGLLGLMFLNGTLFSGFLLKMIFLSALIRAVRDARAYARVRSSVAAPEA
ncbi:hypothetical protein [Flaviaesturariibacter amylovorans]|uniref:Uncharacterized protein n=1 Tax=Flaviaesturariibacter amylovorans TaxID=1084520 RepID=A0ABP8HV50_9BACT